MFYCVVHHRIEFQLCRRGWDRNRTERNGSSWNYTTTVRRLKGPSSGVAHTHTRWRRGRKRRKTSKDVHVDIVIVLLLWLTLSCMIFGTAEVIIKILDPYLG